MSFWITRELSPEEKEAVAQHEAHYIGTRRLPNTGGEVDILQRVVVAQTVGLIRMHTVRPPPTRPSASPTC
jgi:hypothetical protein